MSLSKFDSIEVEYLFAFFWEGEGAGGLFVFIGGLILFTDFKGDRLVS